MKIFRPDPLAPSTAKPSYARLSLTALMMLWALIAASMNGCSSTGPAPEAPDPKQEIPIAAPNDANHETIVILGSNDIHGALAPQQAKSREPEGVKPVSYARGGATYFASHVQILREEFGPRLLWLDGGDEFQGSIESNFQEGAPMVQFFNEAGLNAAAVGNHEFDFGPVGPEGSKGDLLGALKARMSEAQYKYVASNIVDKGTGKMPEFPNTHTRMLFNTGRVKVGVIGLSTLDTPTTTRAEHIVNVAFKDLKDTTLREAAALRKEGADLVVIAAHVGLRCQPGKVSSRHLVRKETDPQGECESDEEMVQLLNSLPAGTVDAVVSGHTHTVVHHWVAGVPVIQGGTRGNYFNLIYLTYDLGARKLVRDRTRIEGPIMVCPQVFENQRDCDGDRAAPKNGRGDLVTPVFHGREIDEDPQVKALLKPILDGVEKEKQRVVGETERPIEHTRTSESMLGNLVTDAIRAKTRADVAMVNAGGLRAPIEAGPITFERLFRTLPFDNSVSVLKVTGKELKNILRVAESGAKGFFPVSGATLKLIGLDQDAPSSDLNGDKRIDPWEINRLKEVRLSNGDLVEDKRIYTLATVDFLVTGGDDMGWAMSQISKDRIQLTASGLIRDVVQEYLGKAGVLNTEDKPLVNPKKPRLVFVKGSGPKKTPDAKASKKH